MSDRMWGAIEALQDLVGGELADFHRLEARIVALEAEVAGLRAERPTTGRTLARVRALHPSTHGLPDGAA